MIGITNLFMKWWEVLKSRLTFKLEFKDKKKSIVLTAYFLIFALAFFVVGTLNCFGLKAPFFCQMISIGSLVYAIFFLYALLNMLEFYFSGNKYLLAEYLIILVMSFLVLAFGLEFFKGVDLIESENRLVSLLASILLVVLPAIFSDEVVDKLRDKFLLVFGIPFIGNSSIKSFMPEISNFSVPLNLTFSKASLSLIPYFSEVSTFFEQHTLIAVGIIVVVFLFLLKFLKLILKFALVAVIIAAVLKYLGLF
mgnify:CR=1 FL=1